MQLVSLLLQDQDLFILFVAKLRRRHTVSNCDFRNLNPLKKTKQSSVSGMKISSVFFSYPLYMAAGFPGPHRVNGIIPADFFSTNIYNKNEIKETV